ncbi:unnamed protein product [Calypogeia fissa]
MTEFNMLWGTIGPWDHNDQKLTQTKGDLLPFPCSEIQRLWDGFRGSPLSIRLLWIHRNRTVIPARCSSTFQSLGIQFRAALNSCPEWILARLCPAGLNAVNL